MSINLPPVTWVIALMACVLTVHTGVAKEPLSVMTYNVRYLNDSDGADVWENRSQAVIETIRSAEVVGLQEVVLEQLDDIREGTPGYQWYGVGRDDGEKKGEMTAIGWDEERIMVHRRGTFWLSDTPEQVGSRGWDAALPRVASWIVLSRRDAPEERMVLVNTHFDHRGQQARANSASLIAERIGQHRGEMPALLIGDLNATLEDRPLEILVGSSVATDRTDKAIKFFDTRELAKQPDPGPDSTWNGFREIAPGRRIDHVLAVGDELEVVSYETLEPRTADDRFASDHLPIRVQLTW